MFSDIDDLEKASIDPYTRGVKMHAHKLLRIVKDIGLEVSYRLSSKQFTLSGADDFRVVVSMKSYPARIKHAWISLESLFRQDFREFRLVLVLVESQFPGRRVPRSISRLTKKGLEILWIERDGRSFDHLWPAYKTFRESAVISVDDDKFFPPTLVSELLAQSSLTPHAIIGARGWEMKSSGDGVEFGKEWIRADRLTPSSRLFMPPGNGSLYPQGSLPEATGDHELMSKICPNADDVWYWAMARLHGTESLCLGLPPHRAMWRQSRTPALADLDPGPKEFAAVLGALNLRNQLLVDISPH